MQKLPSAEILIFDVDTTFRIPMGFKRNHENSESISNSINPPIEIKRLGDGKIGATIGVQGPRKQLSDILAENLEKFNKFMSQPQSATCHTPSSFAGATVTIPGRQIDYKNSKK